MSDRNLSLEHIEGPRVYVPPPNHLIVRVAEATKTKLGILLPGGGKSDDGAGGQIRPVGEVVHVGHITDEEWKECAPGVGDTVLFHPNVLPVSLIHDGLVVVPIRMVYLTVWQGSDVAPTTAGLYWEPPVEVPEVLG